MDTCQALGGPCGHALTGSHGSHHGHMAKAEFVGVVLVDDVELCSMGGAGPVRARGLGG